MLSSNPIPLIGRVKYCLQLVNTLSVKNKTIVDVGASFGWLEKELLKMSPKKVIGIEPSKEALDIAKRNVKRASFLEGSALAIPVNPKTADIVTFFDVIEHVPVNTEKKALAEINRILKSNGILLLTTPNYFWINNLMDPAWYFGHRHYKDSKLKSLLKSAGFEIKKWEKRGGLGTLIYMSWFYVAKIIFRKAHPRSRFMELVDDFSYEGNSGFVTHYIVAQKIKSFKS